QEDREERKVVLIPLFPIFLFEKRVMLDQCPSVLSVVKQSSFPAFIRILSGFLLVALAGCGSTQEHRARQYSHAFGQLPPAQQSRVLDGVIALGDSREAIYIALGPPQAQRFIADVEIWEYMARPIPSETPFTSGEMGRFITPNSGDWKSGWSGKPGYLAVEFENGVATLWDYMDEGYAFSMKPGQRIVLPRSQP
ncbi:MAG: hypothetical protein ACQKBV_12155, partial [Puniceicoccales bacterium]